MNCLIEKFRTEFIYHEPKCNQFSSVCDKIVHKLPIFNTNFHTALISLFPSWLTGKANGFFLKNVNTTNLSNA